MLTEGKYMALLPAPYVTYARIDARISEQTRRCAGDAGCGLERRGVGGGGRHDHQEQPEQHGPEGDAVGLGDQLLLGGRPAAPRAGSGWPVIITVRRCGSSTTLSGAERVLLTALEAARAQRGLVDERRDFCSQASRTASRSVFS